MTTDRTTDVTDHSLGRMLTRTNAIYCSTQAHRRKRERTRARRVVHHAVLFPFRAHSTSYVYATRKKSTANEKKKREKKKKNKERGKKQKINENK